GSAEHRRDERGRDAGRAVRGQVDTGVNDPQAPTTQIPTRRVGPMRVSGNAVDGEFSIPLATYETPLWPSAGRGARVSRRVEGGTRVMTVDERMTRSVLFTAAGVAQADEAARLTQERFDQLAQVVSATSRFAQLLEAH